MQKPPGLAYVFLKKRALRDGEEARKITFIYIRSQTSSVDCFCGIYHQKPFFSDVCFHLRLVLFPLVFRRLFCLNRKRKNHRLRQKSHRLRHNPFFAFLSCYNRLAGNNDMKKRRMPSASDVILMCRVAFFRIPCTFRRAGRK